VGSAAREALQVVKVDLVDRADVRFQDGAYLF